jgi:hypothetical protein
MGRDACLPSSSLPECSHGFTPKNEPGSVTDVITTSASQQTQVDFSVSNAKAREEGGREENCRLRSPCTATKHSHGRQRNGRALISSA